MKRLAERELCSFHLRTDTIFILVLYLLLILSFDTLNLTAISDNSFSCSNLVNTSHFYPEWSFGKLPVLLRVYISTQTSWPKANWGGKDLLSLHFHIAVHHQRKSGLELKQVRKQELMQGHGGMLLPGFFHWLAQPALLHNPGGPAHSSHHQSEALPASSLIEKMPHNWDFMQAFPPTEALCLW